MYQRREWQKNNGLYRKVKKISTIVNSKVSHPKNIEGPAKGLSRNGRLGLLQFDHHSGRYAHGHEFLEQKLASVGNANFGDLSLVAAAFAFERVVPQVGDRHETAEITNVASVRVRNFEKTLSQELWGGREVGMKSDWEE